MSASTSKPGSASAMLDQEYFESITQYLLKCREPKEHLYMVLSAERSHFVRLNNAKVRQTGVIEDAIFEITLLLELGENKLAKCSRTMSLTGLSYEDRNRVQDAIRSLRTEAKQLPQDPYAEIPKGDQVSSQENRGALLSENEAAHEILRPTSGLDIAGIYASGPIVRAMASSSGQKHWFRADHFSLDYSLYTPTQRALKGTFAGSHWKTSEFQKQIQANQEQIRILERDPIQVPKGSHRTYLAPASVADLIRMFSWGCIGEASIRQGDSALRKVRSGERSFSPRFHLAEDFRGGEVPRFNSEGELAPEHLSLIENGKLVNSLVCSRSSREYGIPSNQADNSETIRAGSLREGDLSEADILKRLGTGLYLSNLHYLNWSDQPGGRITGMTRYACFWVEKGQIVAPIENMRFDDSLFNLFGESLEDLTTTRSYMPDVGSYHVRSIGGLWTPGILVSGMNFTL